MQFFNFVSTTNEIPIPFIHYPNRFVLVRVTRVLEPIWNTSSPHFIGMEARNLEADILTPEQIKLKVSACLSTPQSKVNMGEPLPCLLSYTHINLYSTTFVLYKHSIFYCVLQFVWTVLILSQRYSFGILIHEWLPKWVWASQLEQSLRYCGRYFSWQLNWVAEWWCCNVWTIPGIISYCSVNPQPDGPGRL